MSERINVPVSLKGDALEVRRLGDQVGLTATDSVTGTVDDDKVTTTCVVAHRDALLEALHAVDADGAASLHTMMTEALAEAEKRQEDVIDLGAQIADLTTQADTQAQRIRDLEAEVARERRAHSLLAEAHRADHRAEAHRAVPPSWLEQGDALRTLAAVTGYGSDDLDEPGGPGRVAQFVTEQVHSLAKRADESEAYRVERDQARGALEVMRQTASMLAEREVARRGLEPVGAHDPRDLLRQANAALVEAAHWGGSVDDVPRRVRIVAEDRERAVAGLAAIAEAVAYLHLDRRVVDDVDNLVKYVTGWAASAQESQAALEAVRQGMALSPALSPAETASAVRSAVRSANSVVARLHSRLDNQAGIIRMYRSQEEANGITLDGTIAWGGRTLDLRVEPVGWVLSVNDSGRWGGVASADRDGDDWRISLGPTLWFNDDRSWLLDGSLSHHDVRQRLVQVVTEARARREGQRAIQDAGLAAVRSIVAAPGSEPVDGETPDV